MIHIIAGLKKFLFNRSMRIGFLARNGFYNWMSDEKFLRMQFKASMGTELNLESPKTFNEKLQWLKLYNRNPEYTDMVDKYKVKEIIARKLGEEYVVPLIGVWNDPKEIDFNKLPKKFVLKCNHNSSLGICVCRNKEKLNIDNAKNELLKGFKEDCYIVGREWPYKNVKRRILCEKYLTDSAESDCLTDYKFFCFNGFVDSVMVCKERETGHPKFYFFDKQWNFLRNYDVHGKDLPQDFTLPKPEKINEMFEIARALSVGIPHVRIDLYYCNGQIYFGEYTFFSSSGYDTDLTDELDKHWGDLIQLPVKKVNYS